MAARNAAAPGAVSIIERSPEHALVERIEGPVAELPRLIGAAFAATAAAIESGGGRVAGMPFARYHEFGPTIRADVGFPFSGTVRPAAPLEVVELPGGRAVTTTHVGSYDAIGSAWDRAAKWMAEREVVPSGPPWESYLSGPDEPGPPVTQVVWPLD